MNTPDEQRRALIAVYDWMNRLPSRPRVPQQIKEECQRLLRHYPSPPELTRLNLGGHAHDTDD